MRKITFRTETEMKEIIHRDILKALESPISSQDLHDKLRLYYDQKEIAFAVVQLLESRKVILTEDMKLKRATKELERKPKLVTLPVLRDALDILIPYPTSSKNSQYFAEDNYQILILVDPREVSTEDRRRLKEMSFHEGGECFYFHTTERLLP